MAKALSDPGGMIGLIYVHIAILITHSGLLGINPAVGTVDRGPLINHTVFWIGFVLSILAFLFVILGFVKHDRSLILAGLTCTLVSVTLRGLSYFTTHL